MLWPYVFFSFVSLVLFKTNNTAAAIVSLSATAVFLCLDLRRTPRKFLPVILLGLAMGLWLYFLRLPVLNSEALLPLSGEAEVTGVSRKSVIVSSTSGTRLRLTGLAKEKLPPKHARISYSCEIQDVPESTFMVFERLSGVKAWCRVKTLTLIQKPSGLLVDFRKRTLDFLYAKFESMPEKTLIAAFLLGDTDDLSPQQLGAFRDMGLMHLFAVSGLNIALLFAILYLPFRALGLPGLGSALGYAVATGFLLLLDFPVPLLRAWLFMTIGLGMRVIDRRIPSWTLLFLTAITVEVLFPLSTFSMSFILSFGITAAILLFYEPLLFCFAAKNKILNLLAEHTALTFAAGLPALILGYLLFGSAQPLSLLYNLLLVPFSGLYLFFSLIFLAFEPVKYLLIALDALYFRFASWHASHVMTTFPSAEKMSQIISLVCVAGLLAMLYVLHKRGRLWSARRNLHRVLPVTAALLILPYFIATYPSNALYAIPNKVWIYNEHKIATAGNALFTDSAKTEPPFCFPVNGQNNLSAAAKNQDILQVNQSCYIFSGRMKPEIWAANALSGCSQVNLFVSKKMSAAAAEWQQLFSVFGFKGTVKIRRYFVWYSDSPLACGKWEAL